MDKNNIENTYGDKMSKIIMGIMLGYTDDIDDKTKQDFSNSNISHVLAVSGMHITYVILGIKPCGVHRYGTPYNPVCMSEDYSVPLATKEGGANG